MSPDTHNSCECGRRSNSPCRHDLSPSQRNRIETQPVTPISMQLLLLSGRACDIRRQRNKWTVRIYTCTFAHKIGQSSEFLRVIHTTWCGKPHLPRCGQPHGREQAEWRSGGVSGQGPFPLGMVLVGVVSFLNSC